MPSRLSLVVVGAVLLVLYVSAWLAGFVFVQADSARRGLPAPLRLLWLALALVPLLGLTAYVIAYLRPAPDADNPAAAASRRRITLPRVPAGLQHTPTMPVAAVRPVTGTGPVPAADPALDVMPQAQPIRFHAVSGPHAGQEFTVRGLPAQIGRGAEASVRLDGDLGVSRRHAEVYRTAGVLRLRDLNSAHGTFVNGFTVTDKGLAPGDQIQVGHTLLLLADGQESSA